MVNKKGWVKVVESFFAVMLIAGVIAFIFSTYSGHADNSKEIYTFEDGVLNGVKLNSTLRSQILGTTNFVASEDLDNYLQKRMPSYLNCSFVICESGGVCGPDEGSADELFGKSVVLSAEGEYTEPRILSLFCWIK